MPAKKITRKRRAFTTRHAVPAPDIRSKPSPTDPAVVAAPVRKHAHYFKLCPYAEVDVYRTLQLFDVTDQAIGHAIKKLLVAGGRGGGKDQSKDVQEAIDTLERWKEMRDEEALAGHE